MMIKKRCGSVLINNAKGGAVLRDIQVGGWFQAIGSDGKPEGMTFGQVTGPTFEGGIPFQSFDLSLDEPVVTSQRINWDLPVWPLTLKSIDFTFDRL